MWAVQPKTIGCLSIPSLTDIEPGFPGGTTRALWRLRLVTSSEQFIELLLPSGLTDDTP